jgi:uncharacterized RDD family membrane protein YckC
VTVTRDPLPLPAASPAPAPAGSPYAGLATRALAFAIDAAVINAAAWFVALVVGLCLSLVSLPDVVEAILVGIGALAALCWSVAYFVTFWSTTGQTPGDRVLEIRVQSADGAVLLSGRRALVRALALPLSAIPFCAGFLLILFDGRRRALHDRLAGSVVVYRVPRFRPRSSGRSAGR